MCSGQERPSAGPGSAPKFRFTEITVTTLQHNKRRNNRAHVMQLGSPSGCQSRMRDALDLFPRGVDVVLVTALKEH
jgi:hypothetical protein